MKSDSQPTLPARTLTQRLRRLAPFLAGTHRFIVLMVAASALAALTEPVIPALMKPLLDQGFQGGSIALWQVPAALMGLFAVRGFAAFVAQYALATVANRAVRTLRSQMFARVLDAPVSMFANTSSSALSNTVVYEAQSGAMLLVNAGLAMFRDSLALLALLAYLLFLNWQLTLIVLVIFPALVWVMKVLSHRLHRITKSAQDATDRLAYVVEENVLAHRIVRLHAAQGLQGARFEHLSDALHRLGIKSTAASAAMTPLTQLLAAAALSAVICTALWQSAASGTTVGSFAAFITAMLMLIAPIKHLSEVASPITRGLAAVERGLDLLDDTAVEQQGTHTQDRAQGALELHDVRARYAGQDAHALDGVTLSVAPGQTMALVGASGSGKTTLVNLLPRFVEPSAGSILLDGVALNEWNLTSLRRQFAYVSQDVIMFNDTIAANVALGLDIDRTRIAQALSAANLDDYVRALPLGIDTLVGHNAVQLSGGQRQRLAIARALYKDAPILILDEATSALDSESEQAVKSALQRLMAGRTTIIIAHRLSTIEHADRIVVMHGGRLVESGTHAQLIEAGGHYARLHGLASAGSNDVI